MGRSALGQRYFGDLITGTAAVEEEFMGGPRLINNRTFDDLTDTKRYIIGEGFGILTDIQTDPNGDLYVVSLSLGAVYQNALKDGSAGEQEFATDLTGEAPDLLCAYGR